MYVCRTDIVLVVCRCMSHRIYTALVAAFGMQKNPAKCSNGWCRSIINRVRKVIGDTTPYC